MAGRVAQEKCEMRIAELRKCSGNSEIPQFALSNLELDTLLGPNSRRKWVLYLGHFGYQVRRFDQFGWGIAAGNYNV